VNPASSDRYQVVIVGGGPVGVALALDLGRRGVRCALVERHTSPQRIPKGQNLTNRSMELMYFWGVDEEVRAARLLPEGYPIGGVTAYDNLMSEYWYTYNDAPGRGAGVASYFFRRNERLPQYLTEEVMRRHLPDYRDVTALFGWSAEAVEQDDNGVRVTIAETDGSENRVLEADYVVGCDGARSTVREQLGIDRGGADFDQRMVLAVFRSRELHEGLKRFPERTTYRVLRPELKGYWQFFGRVDVGEGWFFHAPVPRDTTPENYDFHGLLQSAAGFEFPCEFDHVGFWDLRIAVASQYRRGRVFIAGDAAHSHPPYGGFGLNSGLEDVANLAWKLTAALQGWGGNALLDSYGEERRPIFVETGESMIAGGIEFDRAFLDRYNPERDRAEFEREWQLLATTSGQRREAYVPNYEGSSVVFGPQGGVSGIRGQHAYTARPGHHLAPRQLTSGRSTYESLGRDFTLLAFGAKDADVARFEAASKALGVPLTTVRDSFEEERADYGARLTLVRPDQHVAWAANAPPEDTATVLRRVTGHD
jgi:2-polyprenyl-6-methoxyphenol hydroxylase-like FAD-dependent oxidoreductase